VGDFMSFDQIVDTLNRDGHRFSFRQIPGDGFPVEFLNTFKWFQAHTYLGSESRDRIALAAKVAGLQPTRFSDWARANLPVKSAAEAPA
jgi:hypothetical protein